jgi:nondiscriminating aspartyl-tRNA synthetase
VGIIADLLAVCARVRCQTASIVSGSPGRCPGGAAVVAALRTGQIRGLTGCTVHQISGIEVDVHSAAILNRVAHLLPFTSSSDVSAISLDMLTDYRPLALRNDRVGDIFRVQAAILKHFREYLTTQHFTEIVSSKIVASGTEGGTNLFEIKYFDRVAYLAQSPQFYKEHGVAGFERVFETGHVYRAEPHATSRHLTEYYSLDLEMGFIDGPEDVIRVEQPYVLLNALRPFVIVKLPSDLADTLIQ